MITNESLYVVAIRTSLKSSGDIFLLVAEGSSAVSRPVTHKGRIMATSRLKDTRRLMDYASSEFKSLGEPPAHVHAHVYIIQAIDAVGNSSIDHDRAINFSVNFLMDILKAVDVTPSAATRRILWDLADHTTFDTNLDTLFKKGSSRRSARNALIWLYGAVLWKLDVLPNLK